MIIIDNSPCYFLVKVLSCCNKLDSLKHFRDGLNILIKASVPYPEPLTSFVHLKFSLEEEYYKRLHPHISNQIKVHNVPMHLREHLFLCVSTHSFGFACTCYIFWYAKVLMALFVVSRFYYHMSDSILRAQVI